MDTSAGDVLNSNHGNKKSKRNKKRKLQDSDNVIDIFYDKTSPGSRDNVQKLHKKKAKQKKKMKLDIEHEDFTPVSQNENQTDFSSKEDNYFANNKKKKPKKNQKLQNKESILLNHALADTTKNNKGEQKVNMKKTKRNLENKVEISAHDFMLDLKNETNTEYEINKIKERVIDNLPNGPNDKKAKRNKKLSLKNCDISDIVFTETKKGNDSPEFNLKKSKQKKNKKFKLEVAKNVYVEEEDLGNLPLSSESMKQKPLQIEKRDNNDVQEFNSKKHKQKLKKVTFDVQDVVTKKSQKPRNLSDEESAIRDEDIDKFCDELDEEDNEQYENWVKLFEENFRSKKLKPNG